mmetsp:Transcript_29580/g.71934  ORF Transcript_29580/g.71934 Transcript_29580/m.71934 type:complete len:615 (+) Transcript_29580:1432-3276(+)
MARHIAPALVDGPGPGGRFVRTAVLPLDHEVISPSDGCRHGEDHPYGIREDPERRRVRLATFGFQQPQGDRSRLLRIIKEPISKEADRHGSARVGGGHRVLLIGGHDLRQRAEQKQRFLLLLEHEEAHADSDGELPQHLRVVPHDALLPRRLVDAVRRAQLPRHVQGEPQHVGRLLRPPAGEGLRGGARAAQAGLGGLPLALAHQVHAHQSVHVERQLGRVVEALGERHGHLAEGAGEVGLGEHREGEARRGVRARQLHAHRVPLLLGAPVRHCEARGRRGDPVLRRAAAKQHRQVGAAQHREVVELALVEEVRDPPEVLVEADDHHLHLELKPACGPVVHRARLLEHERPREPRDLMPHAAQHHGARPGHPFVEQPQRRANYLLGRLDPPFRKVRLCEQVVHPRASDDCVVGVWVELVELQHLPEEADRLVVHVGLQAAAAGFLEILERVPRPTASGDLHPMVGKHGVQPEFEAALRRLRRLEHQQLRDGGLQPLGGRQVVLPPLLERKRVVCDFAACPRAEAIDAVVHHDVRAIHAGPEGLIDGAPGHAVSVPLGEQQLSPEAGIGGVLDHFHLGELVHRLASVVDTLQAFKLEGILENLHWKLHAHNACCF